MAGSVSVILGALLYLSVSNALRHDRRSSGNTAVVCLRRSGLWWIRRGPTSETVVVRVLVRSIFDRHLAPRARSIWLEQFPKVKEAKIMAYTMSQRSLRVPHNGMSLAQRSMTRTQRSGCMQCRTPDCGCPCD